MEYLDFIIFIKEIFPNKINLQNRNIEIPETNLIKKILI